MRSARSLLLIVLVGRVGIVGAPGCATSQTKAQRWESIYANPNHALEDMGIRFRLAEMVEGGDASGTFVIDNYEINADGIRFSNKKSGRFIMVPWDRWERAEYFHAGRNHWVDFAEERIEVHYVAQINRPNKGVEDANRFFAALRYISHNRNQLPSRIAAQPVSIPALRVSLGENDCRRVPAVIRKLEEIRDPAVRGPFVKAQLDAFPAARNEPGAHAVWLITADIYLGACQQRQPIPERVRAGAGPVPDKFLQSAVQSKDCTTLLTVDKMRLWPYPAVLADAVARRDFARAEQERLAWLTTFAFVRDSCGGAVAGNALTRISTRQRALEAIVGLADPQFVSLRTRLLDAAQGGRTEDAMAAAQEINAKENELSADGSAIHDARLVSARAVIQDRATSSEPLTPTEILGLLGL